MEGPGIPEMGKLMVDLMAAQDIQSNAEKEFHPHSRHLVISLRRQEEWSQPQLAELLDISPTYVSKIENGAMQPGRPVMNRLTIIMVLLGYLDHSITNGIDLDRDESSALRDLLITRGYLKH